jgi:hypothetical protein
MVLISKTALTVGVDFRNGAVALAIVCRRANHDRTNQNTVQTNKELKTCIASESVDNVCVYVRFCVRDFCVSAVHFCDVCLCMCTHMCVYIICVSLVHV